MDLLSLLGLGVLLGALALAAYVSFAIAMVSHAAKLASRQEEIPPSLDCRDGRHRGCLGCSCHCHA